jgi:hypothetical protein
MRQRTPKFPKPQSGAKSATEGYDMHESAGAARCVFVTNGSITGLLQRNQPKK